MSNSETQGTAIEPNVTWSEYAVHEHRDRSHPRRTPSRTVESTAAGAAEAMTLVVTPRPPIAAAHAFTTPVVREVPPVNRPGMFDATW